MNKPAHRRLLAECLDLLTSHGIPIDDAVRAVIQSFFDTDSHVAVDDLIDTAGQEHRPISRSEVERAMELLVEYGFATRKVFADGNPRYEHLHLGEHHDHLYCLKCGAILEFYSPDLEEMQLEEARRHGFHAFSHKMQINGLCDKCFGTSSQTLMPLLMVQPGGRFRIVEVGRQGRHGRGHRRRLAELGLVPDAVGEVVSNHGFMVVIQLGGQRLALRRGQTHDIRVTLTD